MKRSFLLMEIMGVGVVRDFAQSTLNPSHTTGGEVRSLEHIPIYSHWMDYYAE